MEPFAPLLAVFAIYIPALLLPGPDFLAVSRAALTRGTAHGMLTAAGVALGLGSYAALSMIGLSALLLEFEWLAWAVRFAGGFYLVFLGLRLLLTRRSEGPAAGTGTFPDAAADAAGPGRRHGAVLFGLSVTLTNPKAVVLFASVFATSMGPDSPPWLLALTVALVAATAFAWYAAVSLFLAVPAVLSRLGRVRHWIERVAGACFVALGGRILFDPRSPLPG
ncbi:LysE family transporter [Marinibaculum pumilum]|uniref:LysE family transporter n=1 Tax=Marinibaculum pumilum TaxID=1766165 RepID=A0ABV7KUT6_9PROT